MILTILIISMNTSMLVTDVGNQMCWWQVWDVCDRFRMMVTDLIVSHCHKVTNITMSPISLSPFNQIRPGLWITKTIDYRLLVNEVAIEHNASISTSTVGMKELTLDSKQTWYLNTLHLHLITTLIPKSKPKIYFDIHIQVKNEF